LIQFTLVNFFQEIAEFDLHFEKVYKWVASNLAEKDAFIACLWKVNQLYDPGAVKDC
jgi:hypothetical protein